MKKPKDTTSKNADPKGSDPTASELIYFIKSPDKKRRSWAIVSFYYLENRKRQYVPFSDERVPAINKRFKSGDLDETAARVMLEEIIDGLYKRNKNLKMVFRTQVLSAENEKLLNEFWDAVYSPKLLAFDSDRSAKDDFIRAFKRIKNKSLYTSSIKDLNLALKESCENVGQHRRAVDRINEVLAYIKRDIRLPKPAEEFKTVRYITEDEVHALAEKANREEIKWLVLTLFGTGARVGEALALTPRDISEGSAYVEKQLLRDGTIKTPKRGKKGRAPIIPSTEKYVKLWAAVKDKGSYRDAVYDFVVNNSDIVPHDLRHSYAIHCLKMGMSLGMVANSLRNRIEVCQKHYTGYEHNTDTLEVAKKILSKRV